MADFVQQGSRGVIWEHELPLEINYVQEQAFFHTFAGDVSVEFRQGGVLGADVAIQDSQFAFVFASETEGYEFYKKVKNRGKYLKCESHQGALDTGLIFRFSRDQGRGKTQPSSVPCRQGKEEAKGTSRSD